MKELEVRANDAGQRLDRFVGKAVPLLPDALLQKYIRLGRIKCNGKKGRRDLRVQTGDILQLYINDEFFEKPREDNAYLKVGKPQLDIIYEDAHILLVNKAPGVLCHSAGTWDYNTLIAHIQAYAYAKGEWRPREEHSFAPALCHRLDRNTGGLVLAAKDAESLRILNDKIRLREIDKRYLCVVHGRPKPDHGTLEGFLFKDAKKNQVYVKDSSAPGTRTAVTRYRTLSTRSGLSLVECELVTGRTHQIRAQLSHAGYPLLGDGKYGRQRQDKAYDEKGQALYAYQLQFAFTSDAGILAYLQDAVFTLPEVPFVARYFPEYTLPEAVPNGIANNN